MTAKRVGWNWTKLGESHDDARVVCQLHEHGCGVACAMMLLADRGVAEDHVVVAAGLHLPRTARELAERLNQLSGPRFVWLGGHLDLDPPVRELHVAELSKSGSWAALLIPEGSRDGRWVVVDGIG